MEIELRLRLRIDFRKILYNIKQLLCQMVIIKQFRQLYITLWYYGVNWLDNSTEKECMVD